MHRTKNWQKNPTPQKSEENFKKRQEGGGRGENMRELVYDWEDMRMAPDT